MLLELEHELLIALAGFIQSQFHLGSLSHDFYEYDHKKFLLVLTFLNLDFLALAGLQTLQIEGLEAHEG